MTTLTRDSHPADAVELRESISLLETVGENALFNDDGTITIHIIRPGIGRGRGKHLYEAEMLKDNAHKFANWKMYVDHLSPEARKAAGGLPRSIRDLGGRIVEAWWDDSVPADPVRGYGQGAVVGRSKPTPFVRELIENDPEIVEASISATATAVRPVVRDGQKVWLVEGIEDRGSVDWVTEAGAGGRVAALLEAAIHDEIDVDSVLLDSMSDDDLLAYLREQRPNLAEGAGKMMYDDELDEKDSTADMSDMPAEHGKMLAKRVKELVAKGMPEKMAMAIAKKEHAKKMETDKASDMKEAVEDESPAEAEAAIEEPAAETEAVEVEVEVEAEATEEVQEAVTSDAFAEALRGSADAQLFVTELVEAQLDAERDAIRAEARADAERHIELRDLRDEAHNLIAESRMPESWQEALKTKFNLVEGAPTEALDVADVVNEEGTVIREAVEVLRDSVAAEIASDRKRLAEAAPTRVRNQGPSTPEGEDDKPTESVKPSYWRQMLEEAGVDPNKAYG
jgi:hypothetical protein